MLQFAYALEQLEADFYTRVVAQFGSSNLSSGEQSVLGDIKNHEVIHREFLKAALGSTYGFTVTATYPNVNFNSRTSVLATAAAFENLGVAAYNGAAQYISSTDYLTLAGKIVSVEARHASAILDLQSPKTIRLRPAGVRRRVQPVESRERRAAFHRRQARLRERAQHIRAGPQQQRLRSPSSWIRNHCTTRSIPRFSPA